MALIDASPAACTERGSFKLAAIDGPSWPHPVVDGGRLYIRSQGTLLCYDARKP
jgi:hypothetical protein